MFINIASLQEMNLSQIRMWFDQIQRLCSGYFYIKQYNKSVNDIDNICIERADYPVKSDWVQVFSRTCTIQDLFFEALYQTRH